MKTGKFYSWEIANENTLIKNCDKSFFEHNGSGIPHEITWFFEVGINHTGRKPVKLIYKSHEYEADVCGSPHGETSTVQILWHSDLGNEIAKSKPDGIICAQAVFRKISAGVYEMTCIYNSENEQITVTPIYLLDQLISMLNAQESAYRKEYCKAIDIEDEESMVEKQKTATSNVRNIKKWSLTLQQLHQEISDSGIVDVVTSKNGSNKSTTTVTLNPIEAKIGSYVQERMSILADNGVSFSSEELAEMQTLEWSHNVLHIGKPLLLLKSSDTPFKKQIAPDGKNNRYWTEIYIFNGLEFFVCSQWYKGEEEFFDYWINPIAKRHNITLPERIIICDDPENKRKMKIKRISKKQQISKPSVEEMSASSEPELIKLSITDYNVINHKMKKRRGS